MDRRTERLLHSHPGWEPETVVIPAGPFVMGSDPAADPDAAPHEMPQHTLDLPAYALGKTPVTNTQYSLFLRATRHNPPRTWRWWKFKWRYPPPRRRDCPAVYVSWYDAVAYCAWLSAVTGKHYYLPNEPEWEKAARGADGRRYPWGNTWDAACCHTAETCLRERSEPVGARPQGASPYGVLGMVGNIWEWTRSLWGDNLRAPQFGYPYVADDGRENLDAPTTIRRVLRGVSFYNDAPTARCAARYRYSPYNTFNSVGFRVALGLERGESGA